MESADESVPIRLRSFCSFNSTGQAKIAFINERCLKLNECMGVNLATSLPFHTSPISYYSAECGLENRSKCIGNIS